MEALLIASLLAPFLLVLVVAVIVRRQRARTEPFSGVITVTGTAAANINPGSVFVTGSGMLLRAGRVDAEFTPAGGLVAHVQVREVRALGLRSALRIRKARRDAERQARRS